MNMLRENMRLIAEFSQQLVSLSENLCGKGTTEKDVSFDTESEWLKHEITLPEGYIFKDENGNVINATKIVLEKKEKEYPKSYEECEKILGLEGSIIEGCLGYEYKLLNVFQKLLMCRDAYWKLYGEEIGLGKPWEPNWTSFEGYPAIYMYRYQITLSVAKDEHHLLVFPTEEMRDAFYENFKEEIEICKEFL